MKQATTTFALFFSLLTSGLCALDLTPHEIVTTVGGIATNRYYFADGEKHLCFKIDSQMTVSGGTSESTFNFGDIEGAQMKVSQSPMQPGLPFDEKNLETYRASARSFLPPGATDVQFEQEVPEAISINDWSSHQFVFNYTLFGHQRHRTITFLNLAPGKQVVIDIGSTTKDYEKTYARGYRVLNSISSGAKADGSGPT